jgi:DNA-directed RNA polymerase subunit RPC12/RpoP
MNGMREFTCGNCGEEFSTNCYDDDIACPECGARKCPECDFWFGGRP